MDGRDPGGKSFGELMTQPDILIIGGGVIGSAAAFFLTGSGKAGKVTVLEPDPLYSKAATPRASGGARRLFSRPENIEMSNYSIPFYESFAEHCTVDGEPPEIGFKRDGYLFIVPPEGVGIIERNHALQTSLGVKVDLLDRDALQRRFPAMNVSDIGAASHAPEDGCLEPNGALQGFRKKARSQGAEYLAEKVVAMTAEGSAVRTVTLSNGEILRPKHLICAAGTWSADVAAIAAMPAASWISASPPARTGRSTTTTFNELSGRTSRTASPSWRS
jgi:FAD-dependent oxidoreductase domain-containing protein 1